MSESTELVVFVGEEMSIELLSPYLPLPVVEKQLGISQTGTQHVGLYGSSSLRSQKGLA